LVLEANQLEGGVNDVVVWMRYGVMRWLNVLFFLMPVVAWAGDFGLVVSDGFKEVVNTPRRVPADWRECSGAVSVNKEWEKTGKGMWYVEMQRDGGRWVQAGLAHGNRETVEWGLKQLRWGFSRMREDGSFDCDDAFHSASFLVEATSHSILLIDESPFADELKEQVDELKGPLLRCALWMISPANFRAAESQRIYAHRRFLLGCGLLQCGMIHRHAEVMRVATYFIEDGMRLQRPDGVFPEKGGHDSGYHAVALIYLQRLILTAPDDLRHGAWRESADRGMKWLLGRIDESGEVKVAGNTRTGGGQEVGRTGVVKQVNLPEVATSLFYGGALSGDAKFEALARKVLAKR